MRGQSSSVVVAGIPVSLPLASLPPVISSVSISAPDGTNSGETISAVPVAWDKYNDLSYVYQWYRSDDASGTSKAAISGATGADYVVQAIDENKFLTCKVTPSNSDGDTGDEVESAYEEIIFRSTTWTQYLSDTYWSNCSEGTIPSITLSWDGAKWVGGPQYAQSACLFTSPSAQVTCSMLEITLTCSHPVVEVKVVGSGIWTFRTAFVSGGAITLSEPQAISWFELEIADVAFEEDVTMEITNIRMYG